jgi:hypothetical protein
MKFPRILQTESNDELCEGIISYIHPFLARGITGNSISCPRVSHVRNLDMLQL